MSIEKETAERFRRDTANHVMTVLQDKGLYRHLRFRAPGGSCYWYEIVTWPGALTIRGDIGESYTFSRLSDMFQFFRSDKGRINAHYWAEKLADSGRSVKEYSEDELKAHLEPYLVEYETEDYPERLAEYEEAKAKYDATPLMQRWPRTSIKEPEAPKSPKEIRQLIAGYEDDGLLSHDEGARELLKELEQFDVVSDTWEWDLNDWQWEFLWVCHAIVAAIAAYDAARSHTWQVRVRRWSQRWLRYPRSAATLTRAKITTWVPVRRG